MIGVRNIYEPKDGFWPSYLGLLSKKSVLIAAEPSLQPQLCKILWIYFIERKESIEPGYVYSTLTEFTIHHRCWKPEKANITHISEATVIC